MNNGAFTVGGPVVIPKVVNGRNKLFFFGNYQRNYDNAPAQSTPTSTVPANREAPQRRLLRPAGAAERQSVSDLRPADRAPGSGAPRQLHPDAVPEQHHPAETGS